MKKIWMNILKYFYVIFIKVKKSTILKRKILVPKYYLIFLSIQIVKSIKFLKSYFNFISMNFLFYVRNGNFFPVYVQNMHGNKTTQTIALDCEIMNVSKISSVMLINWRRTNVLTCIINMCLKITRQLVWEQRWGGFLVYTSPGRDQRQKLTATLNSISIRR